MNKEYILDNSILIIYKEFLKPDEFDYGKIC